MPFLTCVRVFGSSILPVVAHVLSHDLSHLGFLREHSNTEGEGREDDAATSVTKYLVARAGSLESQRLCTALRGSFVNSTMQARRGPCRRAVVRLPDQRCFHHGCVLQILTFAHTWAHVLLPHCLSLTHRVSYVCRWSASQRDAPPSQRCG